MKRIFVVGGVVAALAAGAVGASVWTGRQAEARVHQAVTAENVQPTIYQVRVKSYDRGWFSSDAVVDVELKQAWLQGMMPGRSVSGPVHILIADHIRHGPVLTGPHGVRLGAARVHANLVQVTGPDGPLPLHGFHYRMDGLLRFDGVMDARVAVDPMRVALGADGELRWQGLQGTVITSANQQHVVVALHAGPVSVGDATGRLTVAGVEFNGDLRRAVPGIWHGTEQVSFGRMDGTANGTPFMHVDRITMQGDSAAEGDGDTRSKMSMDVTGIGIRGVDVRAAHIKFAVEHVPDRAVLALRNAMTALNARPMGPQQRARAVARLWLAKLPAFLAHSPTVELSDLRVVTREGDVKVRGTMRYDASVKPASGLPLSPDAVVVHGQMSLPASILEQMVCIGTLHQLQAASARNPRASVDAGQLGAVAQRVARERVQALVDQHWLVREGDRYRAELTVDHGALSINGQAVPMPAPPAPGR